MVNRLARHTTYRCLSPAWCLGISFAWAITTISPDEDIFNQLSLTQFLTKTGVPKIKKKLLDISLFSAFLFIVSSISPAFGADVPFSKIIIDNSTISNPWAKAMADLDGDGYMDMIVAPDNGAIVWYAYPDWTEYTIGDGGTECGIAVADIDNDGDMDVAVGPNWYENPRPAGNPKTSPWIKHFLGQNNHNMIIDFLDGDNKRDIVMVSETG